MTVDCTVVGMLAMNAMYPPPLMPGMCPPRVLLLIVVGMLAMHAFFAQETGIKFLQLSINET